MTKGQLLAVALSGEAAGHWDCGGVVAHGGAMAHGGVMAHGGAVAHRGAMAHTRTARCCCAAVTAPCAAPQSPEVLLQQEQEPNACSIAMDAHLGVPAPSNPQHEPLREASPSVKHPELSRAFILEHRTALTPPQADLGTGASRSRAPTG